MAFSSRRKSHFSGSWLLIRNISFGLLNKPSSLFNQSKRILSRRADSSNRFFRWAQRTSLSIIVRTKKILFFCHLVISLIKIVSSWNNRVLEKNKNTSKHFFSCNSLQYISTSEYFGLLVPGKIQNAILEYLGWTYISGDLTSWTPTGAASSSSSSSLEKECVCK